MKQPQKRAQILLAVALLLYACGYVTQFIGNYAVWQKNGGMLGGTSPPFPSLSPLTCLKGVLWFPYNLYCMAGCAAAVAVIFLYRKLFSQDALTDSERNFDFSAKGTYGTSGWMQTREVPAVLDMVSDLSQHTGTVLGMLDGKFLCIPEKTRMNGNLAVYGASGSMKTRSFCMNRILQSAARGESLIICDPKSELYEKSSEYMRDLGYTVRVFNLVSPENSDSWNCLKEIEGQELMAQLFVDVIIKNTNGTGKSDRFWDSGEMNLLKALVLYVDLTYPPEQRTIGEVYNLITQCSESQLDSLFDVLPLTHPAKAPYSLYQRASDSVRSGVISGLGSRLQVFQSDLIKKITAYDEISLELPGQQHCAYYLVTSDQDSTFDFLASLFLSFAFIKLVRYADANCPGGRLPVPVHVLGEELTACGTISELSRRISVIRSRNISMSCVFQNLAGLQNRYPQNQWQEILGNCDVQLFLGCTDQLTAEYVSQRTGIASVAVSSTSKALSTLRVSDYTPQYRESSGVGKRSVLTPDEVLRLPVDDAYAHNLTVYLHEIEEHEGITILGQINDALIDDTSPAPSGGFGNPFNDPNWEQHITSFFGKREDVGIPGKDTTNHNGLDIAYPYGTPILAVEAGTVIKAGYHVSYGNYLVINHGGGYCTLYAHCSQLLAQVGDTVNKYDTIAKVGATGDVTGNHLHICVIIDGVYVNPKGYLH